MIKAGKLIHKVCIEKKIVSRDTAGGEIVSWIPFTYQWASIEPLIGKEFFAAQQWQFTASHKITIWYRAGIDPKTMRITWGSRVFNFSAPPLNTEERNIELVIYCSESI